MSAPDAKPSAQRLVSVDALRGFDMFWIIGADAHIAKGCGDLLIAAVGIVIAFGLVRFLYQRKIFLRV